MKTWFLYILKCADGTLYTGITNDLEKRFLMHTKGKASKYTRGRRPLKIVFTEEVQDVSSALKREIQMKKLSKRSKEELINEFQKRFR
ncbi:MAG: GIY-YIG nuclease family protein [Candidatus Riflebacteria bacterium]|nr:GIY-YIG nuclease family protein [Candidatus Riflebacteria bacterium]